MTKGDEKIAGAVQEAVQKGDSLSYVGLEGSFAPGLFLIFFDFFVCLFVYLFIYL